MHLFIYKYIKVTTFIYLFRERERESEAKGSVDEIGMNKETIRK